MPSISVVLPVYNEIETIDTCLEAVSAFLLARQSPFEIIAVNDGSTDDTPDRLKAWGDKIVILNNEQNRGKGYSVKRGLLAARHEWLLFLDVDLSTPVGELNKFIGQTNGADALIGSRRLDQSNIVKAQPPLKNWAGRLGNLIIKKITKLRYNDTQCGFKMFHRELKPLIEKLTIDGWGFDIELLYLLEKHKKIVQEVPVEWTNNTASKVTVLGYFRTLRELIKIKRNDERGLYD